MKNTVLSAIAAAALLAVVPAAHAVATLQFQVDGGATVTCADGAACDVNAAAGAVTFVGDLGGGFFLNVTTGVTAPALTTALIDLNSINIQSGGGVHTLTMMFSQTNFAGAGIVTGAFGGTVSGAGSITAQAYSGDAGTLFDLANSLGSIGPFGGGAFAGSSAGSVATSPYSLTQVLTLSTTGASSFSGDYELKIPEPGSLALAGLGLLALGATRRRKQ